MNAEEIQAKAQALLDLHENRQKRENLWTAMQEADSPVLSALIAKLGRSGTVGAEDNAIRGAAVAILQMRMSENLIATMKTLNRSATILYWVGIGTAFVIGVAGIGVAVVIGVAQIVVALLMRAR
jgi:hypothetical protein